MGLTSNGVRAGQIQHVSCDLTFSEFVKGKHSDSATWGEVTEGETGVSKA